ncbi:MAG: phosphatase PAP2 family protein [Chitinophagaceae bacterium]|nr:MAG: phosphatase PAP2 family protein [Chitinophagaceae bacterium]
MKKIGLIICSFFLIHAGFGQNDTLVKKLDSLSQKTDSAGGQLNNTNPRAYNEATEIDFSTFFILQWSNLKQAFTKPFHMTKKNWATFGKFALVTGALVIADEPIQRFALDLRNHNRGLRDIGRQVTNFGGAYEAYTLGALGAYGFLFKNEKMQTTTLLALQSYITGAAVENVLKFITGRQRPFAYNPNQVEAEPTFLGPFKKIYDVEGKRLNGSFPSGHTTVAFAAATVYAMEYRDRPWVPILCYTSALLIGLSRITENKHWLTDVVVGAALGYLTGRQVVNNYHRYAKLKSPKQSRNSVSFSLGFQQGAILPGVVYRF